MFESFRFRPNFLRVALAALALVTSGLTVGGRKVTAASPREEPTCSGVGCLGGYILCATWTTSDGTKVTCLTYH
jgi:hypothetical protein